MFLSFFFTWTHNQFFAKFLQHASTSLLMLCQRIAWGAIFISLWYSTEAATVIQIITVDKSWVEYCDLERCLFRAIFMAVGELTQYGNILFACSNLVTNSNLFAHHCSFNPGLSAKTSWPSITLSAVHGVDGKLMRWSSSTRSLSFPQ